MKAKLAQRPAPGKREIGKSERDRGNRTAGYSSSTNSSMLTPYALAIFVTVGM
jgi:hypothetical protein